RIPQYPVQLIRGYKLNTSMIQMRDDEKSAGSGLMVVFRTFVARSCRPKWRPQLTRGLSLRWSSVLSVRERSTRPKLLTAPADARATPCHPERLDVATRPACQAGDTPAHLSRLRLELRPRLLRKRYAVPSPSSASSDPTGSPPRLRLVVLPAASHPDQAGDAPGGGEVRSEEHTS